MSHSARKAAFREVSDTCPDVDGAFADMVYDIRHMSVEEFCTSAFTCVIERCIEVVKVQTCALRDALILAYEEKEESECELKDQIYMLQKRIEELESRVE